MNHRGRKEKGRVGMKEAAEYLTGIGVRAESGRGRKDIYLPDHCDQLHVEVKRVESMRVGGSTWLAAIEQAKADALKRGVVWAVLWRINKLPWCLTFPYAAEELRLTLTVTGDHDIGQVLARYRTEVKA